MNFTQALYTEYNTHKSRTMSLLIVQMTYVNWSFYFQLMQKLFIHVDSSAKTVENAIY